MHPTAVNFIMVVTWFTRIPHCFPIELMNTTAQTVASARNLMGNTGGTDWENSFDDNRRTPYSPATRATAAVDEGFATAMSVHEYKNAVKSP